MQPPVPPRSRDRLARLRLPELPPRDLERLAAVGTGPHSAPAPSTGPDSAGYLPPPSATPTKFGGEGSPADVRGYAVTPLLMRGGVVSPGVGGGSGLVLPTLSLPLTSSALPPASQLTSSSPLPVPPPPPPPPPTHQQSISSNQNILHNQQQHPHQSQRNNSPEQQQRQQQQQQQQHQQHLGVSTSSSSLSNHHLYNVPHQHLLQQQNSLSLNNNNNNNNNNTNNNNNHHHQHHHHHSNGKSPPPISSHHLTTSTSNIASNGISRAIQNSHSHSGARTTPSSPVGVCGLTQNEIKKAQNRKSAKRFREAQKQRWKNMADDLMSHRRTIDELRAQLAAQANTVAHANNALRAAQQLQQQQQKQQQNSSNCLLTSANNSMDAKRSSVSINDLVDSLNNNKSNNLTNNHCNNDNNNDNNNSNNNNSNNALTNNNNNNSNNYNNNNHNHNNHNTNCSSAHTHAEAEAALYAQILSSKTNGLSCSTSNSTLNLSSCSLSISKDRISTSVMEDIPSVVVNGTGNSRSNMKDGGEPYVKELGILHWCVVVEKSTGRIVSVRRGSPNGVGNLATEGLTVEATAEFRNALLCNKAVAVRLSRNGSRVNAVMNPVEGCDRVVVAEFIPL